MQLSEIRINLCGPAPSQQSQLQPKLHPRLSSHSPHAASTNGENSRAENSRAENCRAENCRAENCRGENPRGGRLRAFCSLTFDNTFVVRDVKLIEGNDGLFLAMPSRKLCDRCRQCSEKNHLRARFCNQCGSRLDENRHMPRQTNGNANHNNMNPPSRNMIRPKLHADIAHPINAGCRLELERRVLMAYLDEVDRSKQPGYIAPNLDGDYSDFDDVDDHASHAPAPAVQLRRTGTE